MPHNLGIVDTKFTIDEVQDAKKQLSEGKAPGDDGIMPEILKCCDIDDILLHFANKLKINRDKPDQLTILNLKPIPKYGNLSVTVNYRRISLTSIVAKLINRMLLNRLRPKIDPCLRYNQNGFRPDQSTTMQVLALRQIIEELKTTIYHKLWFLLT